MITITTVSGSVYLIDEENKKVLRQGKSGMTVRAVDEWRPYDRVVYSMGEVLEIWWPHNLERLEGSSKNTLPVTTTSPIVKIGTANA